MYLSFLGNTCTVNDTATHDTISVFSSDCETERTLLPVGSLISLSCLSLCPLSGMLTVAPKGFHCPDAERNCNPCLDAAKACNLNNSCKKQRSSYIATCSKEDPNKGETCSKKRCHKALRMFLDRVPTEFSHRLLFCPCQTMGCAERRRQTIVPDCSYKDKEKPNCLELRRVCRQDSLCR